MNLDGLKKIGTICILRHAQKFLLLKRAKEPNKDLYTPVGGKLDPFENPLTAAKREILEETGIAVNNIRYCGILTETSPVKYNWVCYVYLSDIDFLPPPPCNEGILEWIDFAHLLDIPTPKTDWFIYQYVLNNKPFAFNADYDSDLNLLNMQEDIEGIEVYKNV